MSNKFHKSLPVGVILFLIGLLIVPMQLLASATTDFGNNGAATITVPASTNNVLVLDLTLPNAWNGAANTADTVLKAGSAVIWQGEVSNAFTGLGTTTGVGYYEAVPNGFGGAEPVVRDLDADSVYTSGADTDIDGLAPAPGTAITTTFDADWTALYMYDTAGAAWESGSDMIFTNAAGVYYDHTYDTNEAGTTTENATGTLTEPTGWNLWYYDVVNLDAYSGVADWIGIDAGGSGTYSTGVDTLIGGVVQVNGATLSATKDADWGAVYFYDTGAGWQSGTDMIFGDDGVIYYDSAQGETLEAGVDVSSGAGTLTEPTSWNLWYYDVVNLDAYSGVADWIGIDDDGDGVYTLTADSLIINNAAAPSAGATLYDMASTDMFMDSDHGGTYTNNEAWVLDDGDGLLNSADTVLFDGPANIIQFTNEFCLENSGADDDGDYTDGEALMGDDGDSQPDSGDTIVKAGKADVTNFQASDGVLFDNPGDNEWDSGTDALYVDEDMDDVYTTAADTIITDNSDTPVDGDALSSTWTNIYYSDNNNGSGVYTDGEAIVTDDDGTLDLGVLNTGTSQVITTGTADLTAFATTNYVLEDTATNNNDFDSAEAILTDNDGTIDAGLLNTGNTQVITKGKADIKEDLTGGLGGLRYNDESAGTDWDTGEDIFTDDDGDGVYTSAADTTKMSGTDSPSAGDTLYDVTTADNLCTDNTDLASATCVYVDTDGTPCDATTGGETYYLGSACTAGTDTEVLTGDNWATTDDVIDSTTDFIKENVAEELTYSAAADTLIYQGAGADTIAAGDTLSAFIDGDNIMYLDTSHADGYDAGEPLILTSGDINAGGELTTAEEVLARASGSWSVDWVQMSTITDIGYCDNSHTDAYVNGEAVLQDAGAWDTDLEATDTVLIDGLCDLYTNWGAINLVHTNGGGTYTNAYNIIDENVDGELTWSGTADVLLYSGAGAPSAGDPGRDITLDPEVIYLDSNHDGAYANTEPLVDVGNGNTLVNDGDLATSGHSFLDRASGAWSADIVDMRSSSLYLGHVDVNNDSGYNVGEPIIKGATTFNANLEATDTIVTAGTSSILITFPDSYAKTKNISDTSTNVYDEDTANEHTYSAGADTKIDGVNPSAGTVITTTKDSDWTTLYFYNAGGATWEGGLDMIFTDDGNIYYDTGSDLLIGGTGSDNQGTLTEPGGWNLYYNDVSDGGVWNNTGDWIGLDDDSDGVYTLSADTDIDGVAPGAGTAITTTKDSDWTTLYFYNAGTAVWEAGSDIIFTDDGNVYYDAGIDTLEAGTGTENGLGTQAEPAGWNTWYYDLAPGGQYVPASDWIGIDTGGSGTYSNSADVDVYATGGLSNGNTLTDFAANIEFTGSAPIDSTESIIDDSVGTTNDVYDRQDDQLVGIGVQNDGTAVNTTDLTTVNAWVEDGSTVGFQSGEDTLLGAMTVNSGDNQEWRLGGLTTAIGASGQRIYVTADVAAVPTDATTMQFALSQLNDVGADDAVTQDGDVGMFVASTNDGPTNSDLQNAFTQTIDTSGPNLTTWDLDLTAPTLTMNFDEDVDAGTLAVTAITVQDALTATTFYTLTDSSTASANGTQIVIDLSATDLAAIQADVALATSLADSFLRMTTSAIDDLVGNPVTEIADGAAVQASSYTAGAPGTLTNTDVTLSSYWMNGDVAATITFTNERAIPADGIIEIVFPTGYDVSGANSATSAEVNGTLVVTNSGQTVTVTRSGGGATTTATATDVSMVLTTIKNPASAGTTGTYTFQTQTSGTAVIDEDTAVPGDTIIDPSAGGGTTTTTTTTGGGGGGGGGQTSSDSNTTTSTIASDLDGTVEGDLTYSRAVEFQPETITVDEDGGTATVQATGDSGTLTIKPNSASTISLTIPSDTTITGEADWTGRINPPLIRSLTNIHPSGEAIEGTDDLLERGNVDVLVEVGGDTPLQFSNEVTLRIPVDLPEGSIVNIYTSGNGDTWIAQGTAVVVDGYLVIMTDHLSYFAVEMTDETATAVEDLEAEGTFTDTIGHWAETYIQEIADMGIVSGKSAGIFAPNDQITRAELTKIATKAYEISIDPVATYSPFGDVAVSSWYTPYIVAAKEAGIVKGYEGNIFSPNGNVNRAEALKILLGAAGLEGLDEYYDVNYASKEGFTYVNFKDVGINEWFAKYVAYAYGNDIVGGYSDGTFGPGNNITRAEVAKIVVKIMSMQ